MSRIRLYMDEDSMSLSLVRALKAQDIDVVTVNDTKTVGQSDREQLRLATVQGRAIFSHNIADFCRLHTEFVASGEAHAGIALLAQSYSVGERIRAITGFISERSAEATQNQLIFLSAYLRD